MVGGRFLVWSVVDGFYGQCERWSVSSVVGGQCFAFLLVGGRFYFREWSVVGGSWSVVLYHAYKDTFLNDRKGQST